MDAIEEIKQRIDIVDFISRYVTLKKAGSTFKANCPFHDERTPSFVVFPHTGTWHCFGSCGTGGDIFSFLMRQEQLDFREALQLLAEEAGIDLEETSSGQSEKQRTSLYEINAATADYFREVLLNHPAAAPARAYLEERQIDAAAAEQFQLGYALDSWDSLRNHLGARDFSIQEQLAAGVLKHNEERNSTYDAFRGRLIFPIRDRQARIIGFGGRVLGEGQPKYLNTSETPIFHKSRVVYGIDLAYRAIRDAEQVVIVEGYMDVLAAHQHGFKNVVACMGTSLTAEQLQQLQRYTNNFVLALDADSAGQQATIRGLNQARQSLTRVQKPRLTATGRVQMEERLAATLSIVAMPPGRDPDDVIREDVQQWEQLVDGAQPLVDYYFRIIATQYDLQSATGKAAAATELAPLIAELNDEIEQQHYIQQLSRLIQVEEATIAARVSSAGRTLQAAQRRNEHKAPEPTVQRPILRPEAGGPGAQAPGTLGGRRPSFAPNPIGREDHLLASLLQEPELLIWLAGVTHELEVRPLNGNDFREAANQEIFRALKQFIVSDEQWDLELFQDSLTSHLHGRLAQLLNYVAQQPQRNVFDVREHVIKSLLQIRIERLKSEIRTSRYLHEEAQNTDDASAVGLLFASHNQNLRERSHLERVLMSVSRVLRNPEGVKAPPSS